MSIELRFARGEEVITATVDVRDEVTLTEVYDATGAALYPMCHAAFLPQAPHPVPVIDWASAPEGFPVWIEDLIPFGESTSCWASDAGSHYLGANGSKWDKPSGIDFAVHHRTQSIAEIIEGADRAVFDRAYVVKDCSPVMAAALLEQLRSSMGAQNLRSVVLMKPASVEVDFHPSIRCADPELTVASDLDAKWPSGVKWLSVGEPFQAPEIDWQQAPEGATHALMKHLMGIVWLKVGTGSEPAYRWSDDVGGWVSAYAESAQALGAVDIVARPAPREKWSLDGKDGNWNYDTLAELILDCYGHDGDGDGHPASGTPGLYEGDTIYRGIACFDDPVRFLPEAHDVLDYMADATSDSEASEYADNYPDVDDDARAALEVALEPLKAWARKHCQPDFFTVRNVTPYILTEEDVRAAKAQERAR